MAFSNRLLTSAVFALALVAATAPAFASNTPEMDSAVERIQHDWEHIKYQVQGTSAQHKEIRALVGEAHAVSDRYPNRAEPLIWEGIVNSEAAAMSSGFEALGFANAARRLFEAAYRIDPHTLEAGAGTSLGVLYDRVPGFPIGFGDKAKARRYLAEAVSFAPDGLDANFFYGAFLNGQGDYAEARKVLEHALALPPHPDRPLWDAGRRQEIRAQLTKVNARLRTAG